MSDTTCNNCLADEPDVGVTGLCPECGVRLVRCAACESGAHCDGHWGLDATASLLQRIVAATPEIDVVCGIILGPER